ncbi:hypothetical protein [Yinghuangia soli]|uniref:DUF1579 domain-containing protein n=1 Tax=Yinghuangia soli TaxID=2908204 RepID=A0AA41TZN2_9ACTN|nr:hypothetical protein [Yinghuangia soli]MCF2527686.1 hypothetical protein [Yinghuangia soli]
MDDFDFLHGTWDVANRKLVTLFDGCTEWDEFPARSVVRPLLDGLGNLDEMSVPTRGWAGATLRLFDLEHKTWSIYWCSSRSGRLEPPVVGGFEAGVGAFQGDDAHEGRPIKVRFAWHVLGADHARWEQRFSADAGETWELNWVMDYHRVAQ